MAKQTFDPILNFDFTTIGYRHQAIDDHLINGGDGPKAIVKLTIADSLIASREISLATVGTATANSAENYQADVVSALRDMAIETGRYSLSVQPFCYSYYKTDSNAPSGGPPNPDVANVKKVNFDVRRISVSRNELLVKTKNPIHQSLDGTILKQYGSIANSVLMASNGTMLQRKNVSEFSVLLGGQLFTVVNAAKLMGADAYTAVIKVDRPIPDEIPNGVQGFIVQPFGGGYTVPIDITTKEPALPGTIIRPPDFTIKTNQYQIKSTNYLNKNQLLTPTDGLTSSSLQNVLDKALSGSGVTSAELGIDYRRYENFVYFGSAKERLENFYYKLQKIEHYSESIRVLSGSHASESFYNIQNTNMYLTRSNNVISSFDDYERYLYYNSSSNETSSLGLYSASTWPKTNSEYPYINQKTTDAEAIAWYKDQQLMALDYDVNNLYNLEKTIPVHVRVDDQNANYLTFVHMIGQHFDTLWTYVQHINKLYDRDERFNIGISKDILYEALGSLGWTAQSGYSIDELWSYYNGTPFSGSTYDTLATPGQHPTEDITKEIWNRTLNNLPYLLKTRGTERGVKALLSTYGMPSTLLQVSEYGGQSKEQSATTYYKKFVYNRSLQFQTESLASIPFGRMNTAYTRGGVNTGIDTHEIRIKPTLFAADSASVIIHGHNRWGITIEPHPNAMTANSSMSNHAQLSFYIRTGSDHEGAASCSTGYLPLYDNDWWNIQLSRTQGADLDNSTDEQEFKLMCQKADDFGNGKITHTSNGTCTINDNQQYYVGFGSATEPDELILGASESSAVRMFRYAFGEEQAANQRPRGFSGSMQEYRAWHHTDVSTAATLEQEAYDNHTLNPVSIEGNSYTASYTDLIVRYPLGTDNVTFAVADGTEISSSHPRSEVDNPWSAGATADNTLLEFVSGFANNEALDWNNEEEHHYIAMPDIAGNRAISDKIRIDTSPTYSGQLSRHSSSLTSSIELAGPDSPIVGVHFSPSHHIDLDIASQLGGSKVFDDFIGNPRDTYRGYYKELKAVRDHYWKKYNDRPTFQAYMNVLKYFDTSLFKQVDMMLPGRAIKQVGLEIRPTLLERNTVPQKSASYEDVSITHNVFADDTDNQRGENTMKSFNRDCMQSSSIALSETATDSNFGSLNPTVKTLQPFSDNYAYDGMPVRDSSFVRPFTASSGNSTFFQIGEQASNSVPIYSKLRTSVLNMRVNVFYDATGSAISRSLVPAEAQDYRAVALQKLYFTGCKIGSVPGSIGGVISYRGTDNTLTYPGIIPGVLSAVEVVETNPNTVQVQPVRETIALPELLVR